MTLDTKAAHVVVAELAGRLGIEREEAADAVLTVANEQMITAIHEITTHEGIDPRETVIVAGGGAMGLTMVPLARGLGVTDVLAPCTGGVLSAMGGLLSEIVVEFSQSAVADTSSFDKDAVNRTLDELELRARGLGRRLRRFGIQDARLEYLVDAHYAGQVWELEVPMTVPRFERDADVRELAAAFDRVHWRTFSVIDRGAPVECMTWKLRLRAAVAGAALDGEVSANGSRSTRSRRDVYFGGAWHATPVVGSLPVGESRAGPLIVAEPTTTLVVPPDARIRRTVANHYHVEVEVRS
jgi:N-methylhydantoinase A